MIYHKGVSEGEELGKVCSHHVKGGIGHECTAHMRDSARILRQLQR